MHTTRYPGWQSWRAYQEIPQRAAPGAGDYTKKYEGDDILATFKRGHGSRSGKETYSDVI